MYCRHTRCHAAADKHNPKRAHSCRCSLCISGQVDPGSAVLLKLGYGRSFAPDDTARSHIGYQQTKVHRKCGLDWGVRLQALARCVLVLTGKHPLFSATVGCGGPDQCPLKAVGHPQRADANNEHATPRAKTYSNPSITWKGKGKQHGLPRRLTPKNDVVNNDRPPSPFYDS